MVQVVETHSFPVGSPSRELLLDPPFVLLSSTLFSPLLSSSLTASLLPSFLVLFLGTTCSLGRGSSFYNRRGYHICPVCMHDALPDAVAPRPPSVGPLTSATPLDILCVVLNLWRSECEWSCHVGPSCRVAGLSFCPLLLFSCINDLPGTRCWHPRTNILGLLVGACATCNPDTPGWQGVDSSPRA